MKHWTWVLLIALVACNSKKTKSFRNDEAFSGFAQGTSFLIKYEKGDFNPQDEIMRILKEIDHSMSLYDTSSLIVKANRYDSLVEVDTYFAEVFEIARNVYKNTGGAFDPTVFSLVQYWGFGPSHFAHPEQVDTAKLDSLMRLKGFDRLSIVRKTNAEGKESIYLRKENPGIQVDFNGIAQGYTVDKIAEMFESKGFKNYMVELGGEIRSKGENAVKKPWSIGIDKPVDSPDHQLIAVASVSNMSLATSGNYRNYYEKDGKKYSHTINPQTGYPVDHNLLSVSVLAETCAEADAYATAFMVMGTKASMDYIQSHPEMGIYLIYSEKDTPGFSYYISDLLKERLELL